MTLRQSLAHFGRMPVRGKVLDSIPTLLLPCSPLPVDSAALRVELVGLLAEPLAGLLVLLLVELVVVVLFRQSCDMFT